MVAKKDAVKDIKEDIWDGEVEFRYLRANISNHLSHTLRVPTSVHATSDSRKECIAEVSIYLRRLEACHAGILHDEAILKKLLR